MAELKEGLVGGALNLYFIYKFLRILTTPWESTDAFKLGIVNEKGKILKKHRKLKLDKEKEAYTMMHRLVWKLKRLMEKIPFGKSRLASYAAALWLIKEEKSFHGTDEELQESFLSFLETDWKNNALILREKYEGDMDKKTFSTLRKEGIDIEKSSMKDVIKDFQSSDAPQFKGKSDKKKKEMAIAAKLSKEEVELDEKWAVGVVYHQEFKNGDRAYFRADVLQKNRRWKGMQVDEFGGKQKKAKNATADEKTQGWETTPKNEIPKALKEEVEVAEADKEALKRALAISKWKKAGGKIDKQPDNIEKWWGQLSPEDQKRAATIAQYKKEKKQKKEEVETEASTYRDKMKDDEKKKKKGGLTPMSQKKTRWGAGGYGKGEEVEEKKAATGYELYHKTFSDAMQHAYAHAKTKGFIVDPKEIDDKVATGPKKPSSGKTNRYELKAGRKTVFIQVANLDNKRYELNMYIEGLEEGKQSKEDKLKKQLALLQLKVIKKLKRKKYKEWKEEVELDEVKSKYEKDIEDFMSKGGKVKKLKPGKSFKSMFKQKGPKKPPRKEEVELDESEANDKRNAAINVGIDLRTYLKKDKWFNFELEKIRDILLKGKLPQVKDMPDDDKSKKVILKLMKNNMKNKFAKRYKGYSSAFDTWITEESELTESTTTDKKNTFTMAPFEDLRSVADAALKIMTRQPQEVKEEEKEEVTKEDQPQTLTEQIV